jgi:hypothetical protein
MRLVGWNGPIADMENDDLWNSAPEKRSDLFIQGSDA